MLEGKTILCNYVEYNIDYSEGYDIYFDNKQISFNKNEFERLIKGEIVTKDSIDYLLKDPVVVEKKSNIIHCVFNCKWNLDYDNIIPKIIIGEDLSEFNAIISVVLRDFANKICKLREENPYSMPEFISHSFMYTMIDKKWGYDIEVDAYKKLFILTESEHNICNYITDMVGEDPKTIRRWCGGGEFPFIEVYAFKFRSNEVGIAYKLVQ